MAEESSEEKNEAPTQKRRDDARKEGQVAFSKELNSAAILGAILALFALSGGVMIKDIKTAFTYTFTNIETTELSISFLQQLFERYLKAFAMVILPTFGTAVTVGLFASVMQVGISFSAKPLEPKLDKLSPLKGVGRIFSKQSFSELLKSLFKMGIIGYLGYISFMQRLPEMLSLPSSSPDVIVETTISIINLFVIRFFIAMATMAIFDFMFQKWDLEQKLKMSKQDIKEEMKQSEGDPQLKAKIRQIQQQMSQARMMQEVPKADVLVTNPTHFAIALLYERGTMGAPQIIAKGMDHIALRMIEIAKENNVPVMQNPPVARGIYFQSEIGDNIPEEFYKAVAEILAFVYKTKKKR